MLNSPRCMRFSIEGTDHLYFLTVVMRLILTPNMKAKLLFPILKIQGVEFHQLPFICNDYTSTLHFLFSTFTQYCMHFGATKSSFYPTAIKGCVGIVFIHGIFLGSQAGGGTNLVQNVFNNIMYNNFIPEILVGV